MRHSATGNSTQTKLVINSFHSGSQFQESGKHHANDSMAQVSNIHLIDSEKTNKSRNTNLQPNSKTQTERMMQAKKATVKKKTVSRPATGKLH